MDELLTIVEVARLMKVSRFTVYNLIDCGDLEAVEVSPSRSQKRKCLRIRKSEYERYIIKVGVYEPSI